MGASIFGKAKNDCRWGSGGGEGGYKPPPGGPGQCLGEGVHVKPPNNFVFFHIKHIKMVNVRVNIG